MGEVEIRVCINVRVNFKGLKDFGYKYDNER